MLMKRQSIGMLVALAACTAGAADMPGHDALMERARNGDYQPALSALRQQPLQGRVLHDYITVAGWAGQAGEVIKTYEAYGRDAQLPAYALVQVARAYRDARRWSEALSIYAEGARRFPEDDAFALGAVMTLADAGRADEALPRAQALVARRPQDADRRLALAYVHTARNQPFEALAETDRAHDLAPTRPYVKREYILALRRARMPGPALREANANPGVVDAALMRALQGDAVAEQARLADYPARGEAERFAIADRALAIYDRLITQWNAEHPRPDADIRRLRIDRIAALHARYYMDKVVSEYEALRDDGAGFPDYALSDVAGAYLYLREPEKARELYERLVASPNEAGNAAIRQGDEAGLYYALIESETFQPTVPLVQAMQERETPWQEKPGAPRVPNELKLGADTMAANASLYANDTAAAQQAFDRMVAAAPNNTGLLTAQARVQRMRSLPRASERTLKMAETLSPRDRGVELGQGATALQLQEWRQAEVLQADMHERFPEDRNAQRLTREWQVHNMAELRVNGYRGLKSDSPVAGSHDRGIDAVLYSPPLNYNWRAFMGGGHASSRFNEGPMHYNWVRGGVQWRGRDLTVEGEISTNHYGSGGKPGIGITVAYDVNDHWQLGGGAAWRSRATPLRALAHGIDADRIDLYARWRADDQREWTFGVSPSRFSDGNNRTEVQVSGLERFYSAPHWWLDGLLDVSASHNSRESVPYYNPKSDFSVLPALRLSHILHRRYETVWEHHLTVGVGTYHQRGYGSGAIGMWEYGHRYRTNDVFEVGAAISGLYRPYDGRRERDLRLVFDVTYRF